MMFLETVLPIVVAAVAGSLIGLEREVRDKSAGFRTMTLIAVGSALFTILSLRLGQSADDATRIAAGVVTGVGFLGAGAILKDGINVRGLTTAASIWLVASLGMAAGAGMYDLVGIVTGIILLVLWLVPPFERWIDAQHDSDVFTVTVKNTQKAEEKVLEIFESAGAKVFKVRRTRTSKGERTLRVHANMSEQGHDELSSALVSDRSILSFED